MGIGQALLEASQLDEEGRQRNPHLLDYKLVTASDGPRIDVEWIETPAENGGPNGTRESESRRPCRRPARSRTRSPG